jgi:hypothetical protein
VPGDEIVMPEDWPIQPLIDRRFKVVPVDSSAGQLQLPKVATTSIGCVTHHLVDPDDDAMARRARERHAEVIVLPDDAPICSKEHPCTTATCEVYNPMAFTLSYVAVSPASTIFDCGIHIEDPDWESRGYLRLQGTDGSRRELPVAQGRKQGDYRRFMLRVRRGVKYSAELAMPTATLSLFVGADLARFADPSDPYDLLPAHSVSHWRPA